ncbi:MAG TPA: M13 family metallopeptidase [Rhizomicrobium sp.]
MRANKWIFAAIFCAGCATFAPTLHPAIGDWGVDLKAMDPSVRPGDDFFTYVNGNWLKTAVIPPDRSSTGAFQALQILSETRMQSIFDELNAKPESSLDANERKLRDLYHAFTDQKAIEAHGLAPVAKDLARIEAAQDLTEVAHIMASVPLSTASIFGINISVDDKNSSNYSIDLSQSGLGLPDREYYLGSDPELAKTRDAYRKYLATMLTLGGFDNAAARAQAVFDLETRIAKAQWDRADSRDATKVYNPMTVSELQALTPEFPWTAFFTECGVPLKSPHGERSVIVAQKSAFPELARIFAGTPVSVWRDYLAVHYLHSFAPYLPKAFDDADFAFYGTVIGGRSQQLPRATRAVHLADDLLGEALGKIYVARYFPPRAKAKAEKLVGNLVKAYEADIKTLDWMSPQTRLKALEKIRAMVAHIGYPDHWRDYSAYVVTPDDLVGDVQRGAVFDWNRQLKRIDGPVDKDEWDMTPPTINAYNNFNFNEIVFPAAILQPPFFDPDADDAVNYGGIGAVIGHEISHSFDDQGSKYNARGELEDWWTADDRKNFDARTAMLSDQFDAYEPLPGLHIIGKNTLGENIADLAGVTIALKAYHISLQGRTPPVLDGFTGDQRFFLSYGQIWRGKYRDSALRAQVLGNEHAPGQFRVDGATRNDDAWYAAFNIQPGDKYYLPPDKRVHLW